MTRSTLALTALLIGGLAAPGWAQKPPTPPAPPSDQASKPPAPAPATDPSLQVATVRLEGGYRASKVIGAAVYNADNQQIGTVDDIIMNHENHADLVVISVGGFLGVGGKLVALPYGKVERADNGRVILADGSKDNLAKLPSFTYAQ
jgi:sporulation protein YlmC with PRC-barrel domain